MLLHTTASAEENFRRQKIPQKKISQLKLIKWFLWQIQESRFSLWSKVKALRLKSFDTSFFSSKVVVHKKKINYQRWWGRQEKFCKICFSVITKRIFSWGITKIDDDKEDEIYWRFWPRDNKTFFYRLSPAVVVEVGFGIGHQ